MFYYSEVFHNLWEGKSFFEILWRDNTNEIDNCNDIKFCCNFSYLHSIFITSFKIRFICLCICFLYERGSRNFKRGHWLHKRGPAPVTLQWLSNLYIIFFFSQKSGVGVGTLIRLSKLIIPSLFSLTENSYVISLTITCYDSALEFS